MLARPLEWLRRRPLLGIAGSLALHLALIGTLLWVGPPSSDVRVRRGEPLFVDLKEADEQAPRGLPAERPEIAAPKPPAPRPKPAAPPPKPSVPPSRSETPQPKPTPPKPAPRPRVAAPPKPAPAPSPRVAQAPPAPTPSQTALVTPSPLPAPAERAEAAAAPLPTPETVERPARPSAVPSEPSAVARPGRSGDSGGEQARERPAAPPGPAVASVPDVRAALARRGSGGAGGRGEGRAGIEGEPIPLDSKDPKYDDYLDRIRRMIKAKWVYPCVRESDSGQCEYKSAQLVIEFGILKDGRVPFVEVRSRSAFDIYDEYAVNAIKLASPFPPVPPAMLAKAKPGSAGVSVAAHFVYIVESSLTNLLR